MSREPCCAAHCQSSVSRDTLSKAAVWTPSNVVLYKSENTAFEMGILLLQSMAAENTAETVAASSYLPIGDRLSEQTNSIYFQWRCLSF